MQIKSVTNITKAGEASLPRCMSTVAYANSSAVKQFARKLLFKQILKVRGSKSHRSLQLMVVSITVRCLALGGAENICC